MRHEPEKSYNSENLFLKPITTISATNNNYYYYYSPNDDFTNSTGGGGSGSNSGSLMEPKLLMSQNSVELVSCLPAIGGPTAAPVLVGDNSTISNITGTTHCLARRRAHYIKKIQQLQLQQQPTPTSEHYASSIGGVGACSVGKSMQNQIIGSFYCIDDCGDIMKRKIKQQSYVST